MAGSTLTLPPFGGLIRRIVLAYLVVYLALALLTFALGARASMLMGEMVLVPSSVVHGRVWQLFTYSFYPEGVLSTAFALLTVWFTGATLEAVRSRRWLGELVAASIVGGALLATLLAYTHLPHLRPDLPALGPWGLAFGLLVGFASLFGEQEILFFFVLRMKAKYLIAIYALIELAMLVRGENVMSAVTQLASGLCAYLFVRFAPVRGFASGAQERYFGVRNSYFRWKRRRAARKFEVYMRKQNREVHFDADGRYIEPEERPRGSSDKKWMN